MSVGSSKSSSTSLPEPGRDCTECIGGLAPKKVTIEISGIQNGLCETCEQYNGTYELEQEVDGGCSYVLDLPEACYPDNILAVGFNAGVVNVFIRRKGPPLGSPYIQFRLQTGLVFLDCMFFNGDSVPYWSSTQCPSPFATCKIWSGTL